MSVISVSYFIGRFFDDFEVPQPAEVLAVDLPDEGSPDDPFRSEESGDIGQRRMAVLYGELATRVAASGPTVVYAGDCLAPIGVLAGLQHKGIVPTLYWFDAHGDFNTWETSESNFLGGMPLAMITARGEQTIVEGTGMKPLPDERVVLVDARDLDLKEGAAIAASGLTVMSVDDVAASEPPPGPIYVHVDVDVVDPTDLPAVNYPALGGPGAEEVQTAIARLAATERVVAASISSWNPALPDAAKAAAVTRSIMEPLLKN